MNEPSSNETEKRHEEIDPDEIHRDANREGL